MTRHGSERVGERAAHVLGADVARRYAAALEADARRRSGSVAYLLKLDQKFQVGASNGDLLAWVFEGGSLVTVMLRRSSQQNTAEKFRTAEVVTLRKTA